MGGVFINEDAWGFYANRSGAPWNCPIVETMDEAGLKRQIDYYAVPGVAGILFNGNAMRAFFDSHAFDPLWAGMDERPDGKAYFRGKEIQSANVNAEDLRTLCRNVRALFQNVEDPYRVRYDYCRQKGVGMWVSMRMNDVHCVDDPERIMHGALWRDHPELRRAFYKKDYTFWFSQCFDYGHQEVRDHHMALVKEYLERFEMDGLELDWMRSPFFFKPGCEQEGRGILTEFMREAKTHAEAAAAKWGHPVNINVRVPTRPEEALSMGLDVFAWARESLVDMVTPSPYFNSSESNIPLEIWRQLLPAGIVLAPCLEQHVGSGYLNGRADSAADAGFAASYFHRGADCVYLFNHMYRDGLSDKAKQREMYGYIGDREKVERVARRHIATVHECMVEGLMPWQPAFPERIHSNSCVSVRLNVGGGAAKRKACVVLGETGAAPETLEVWLNARLCQRLESGPLSELPVCDMRSLAFGIPADALHDGENQIDIINKDASEMALKWVEIQLAPHCEITG